MIYETIKADTVDELNHKVNAKLKHGFRIFGGASMSTFVTVDQDSDEDVVNECYIQTLIKDDGSQAPASVHR